MAAEVEDARKYEFKRADHTKTFVVHRTRYLLRNRGTFSTQLLMSFASSCAKKPQKSETRNKTVHSLLWQ